MLQLSSMVEGLQRDNQQLGQRLEQMQREASRHIQAREAEISRLRLAASRAADAQGGNSAEVYSIATPVDAQTPVETAQDAQTSYGGKGLNIDLMSPYFCIIGSLRFLVSTLSSLACMMKHVSYR